MSTVTMSFLFLKCLSFLHNCHYSVLLRTLFFYYELGGVIKVKNFKAEDAHFEHWGKQGKSRELFSY